MATLCEKFMKIDAAVCQKNRVKVGQKRPNFKKFWFFRLFSNIIGKMDGVGAK